MCKAKADGGYRCATHGESRRRELTDKLHETAMQYVPEEDRGTIGRGFTLPPAVMNHVETEAHNDGSVKVADARVKRAQKSYSGITLEVQERMDKGDIHGALMDNYEPYRAAYNNALANGEESAKRVAKEQQGYFLALNKGGGNDTHAYQMTANSPERKELQSATSAHKEALDRAVESRREEMSRMVDPRFREALVKARDTEEGRKALYNLAMHRVENRFSEAYGGSEYRKTAKLWRDMGMDEMADDYDTKAKVYEEAHEAVGTRNRASAYADRVSAGKFLKPGEEVKITDGMVIVHASDQKEGAGRYKEGTDDCRMAVSMEWMRSKKVLAEHGKVEMERLTATKFHGDKI